MPRKIVIDTDPGVDDVLAILLALASPEVDVRLISIIFGNTHAPVAHSNLLKIYHLLAQEVASIPAAGARYARLTGQEGGKTILALGEDGPIGGEKAVASYYHGPDGLSNISVTHPHFTPPPLKPGDIHDHLVISDRPASENILELLRSEPADTVTIVALGPLTNIAHALRDDPQTFAKVHTVVWMGGALDHPGNTSPSAEFNCFADPYAADQVLTAVKNGIFEMVMAPLDMTTPHRIPFDDLIHSSYPANPDQSLPPLRHFISAMLGRVRGLQAGFRLPDAMEMHDPVAVWYAIAHSGFSKTEQAPGWQVVQRDFKIERIGEYTRGMCVVDRRGTGEAGVDRTKSERLKQEAPIFSPIQKEGVQPKSFTRPLPQVVVQTPGSEELRKVLLSRVFGMDVDAAVPS